MTKTMIPIMINSGIVRSFLKRFEITQKENDKWGFMSPSATNNFNDDVGISIGWNN